MGIGRIGILGLGFRIGILGFWDWELGFWDGNGRDPGRIRDQGSDQISKD